jgi:hypothetical protein
MAEECEPIVWRTSSFCGSQACVEVAMHRDRIYLRDSAEPAGPRLEFDRAGWAEFVAGIRAGRL